ncbi:guanylate kinase [Paenibacillus lignilyticus]|uniref:Guanylate kinase n=1 Tax=Paenibacillus lignilyticus TaxID=1172615 RepID=A0ABS5CN38_9BACL|nr:guanylate kinase [Paenibacillus lignilyticus]MBP3967264.1 guanylate kinase [Paenibacillus lignilyticus]
MSEQKDRELIFVFTGPDGSGRKTVADSVGTTLGITKVISYATRRPRPGEVNGQDYHFITPELYDQFDADGDFIESVTVNGNRYGLRGKDIAYSLKKGGSIYLILNHEGAHALKDMYGERVVRLFIYADRRTVQERQAQEGIDPDIIKSNLDQYETAIRYQPRCEHAFENYDLAHTVFEISNTLESYLERNLEERD